MMTGEMMIGVAKKIIKIMKMMVGVMSQIIIIIMIMMVGAMT